MPIGKKFGTNALKQIWAITYTDYTFNLVQLRPSLIVLVSSCIGINQQYFTVLSNARQTVFD